MTPVLVIAEHDGVTLNPATARSISCAASLPDAQVTVAVLAADPAAVAAQASRLTGVSRVLAVANPANERLLAAVLAPQIVALAAPFSHVFAPSTTFGKDLMPRVAALLGAPQVSDIMAVESATRFRRPVYAGNAIITVEVKAPQTTDKITGTVRTASYAAAVEGATAAPVETVSPSATLPTHTRFVSMAKPTSDRPDLQAARRVVSGGRALGSSDGFKLVYDLADRLGAAVGASRAAVDAGYVGSELQVGQTGKIIAPELYIALGISGAIQHLTGIKDARIIVAINKDPEAPIFEVADYGIVGDLFQLVPELNALL